MVSVEEFLKQHNARVDEDKRLYLECLCDGTLVFQIDLIAFLKSIGCTDIKIDGHDASERAPQDKPWCSWLYEASGVLPEGTIYFEGSLYRFIKEQETGYLNSEFHRWLNREGFPENIPQVYQLPNPNDMLFVPKLTEGQYIDTGFMPESWWAKLPDSIKSKTCDIPPIERERNYLGKWNLPDEGE